ncbi:MAG: hypothetical protein HOL72_03855 [Euryarchaeota archaeon]|jgi:hypothetical protein|nr:hypothetical protein [Euryarchaeota archaeon]MBT5254879.1 hypothetical protein [Euryarchaeota archaeon]
MGIIKSVAIGFLVMMILPAFGFDFVFALGISITSAFLAESSHHRSQQRKLLNQSHSLRNQLNDSGRVIFQLQNELSTTNTNLTLAINEIQRRDAIGSPATRHLLARQEEAINAQTSAIEAHSGRNDDTLDGMNRLLMMQAQQTAKMQQTLVDVLNNLLHEPRQNVTMQDSVLVQESSTKPAISANIASAPDYSSLVFAE